jgi:hypothetical protein
MSSYVQESARDAAITPKLIAVKEAIAKWARASTDGAAVWEASEELTELWHDWKLCLGSDAWSAIIGNVTRSLTSLAMMCPDQGVADACVGAKLAIEQYREGA